MYRALIDRSVHQNKANCNANKARAASHRGSRWDSPAGPAQAGVLSAFETIHLPSRKHVVWVTSLWSASSSHSRTCSLPASPDRPCTTRSRAITIPALLLIWPTGVHVSTWPVVRTEVERLEKTGGEGDRYWSDQVRVFCQVAICLSISLGSTASGQRTGPRLYMELCADSGWMMLPTPDSDASQAGLGHSSGYMEPSVLSLEEVDGFLSHIDSPGHPYFHTHAPHPQARASYSQGKETTSPIADQSLSWQFTDHQGWKWSYIFLQSLFQWPYYKYMLCLLLHEWPKWKIRWDTKNKNKHEMKAVYCLSVCLMNIA